MKTESLGTLYSSQARLTVGGITQVRELKGDELFTLFRQQADAVGPIAMGWGYPPLLAEKMTWGRTVAAARQIRAALCRAWSPETATLQDALRLAYLIDLSMTSVVESFDLLWETLGPAEPREGKELEDAIDLLAEAGCEVGSDLFDEHWLRLVVREPSYEPTLVPAAIVASWVAIHRRDLIGPIEDKAAKQIPEVEWNGTELGLALNAFDAAPSAKSVVAEEP